MFILFAGKLYIVLPVRSLWWIYNNCYILLHDVPSFFDKKVLGRFRSHVIIACDIVTLPTIQELYLL